MTARTGSGADAFAERLDRLAQVAIRVGLNLREGQELVLTAPLEALPLARAITAEAYRAGASLVTTLLADDRQTLARFEHADEAAFDTAAGWLYAGMAEAYRNGAARLAISGDDPALLSGQDPGRVARANRARSQAYQPALDLIANFATNWTIVSAATPAWARTVFPDLPEDEAVARLWDAIFSASRCDGPDPIAAWTHHNAALRARTETLNGYRFAALRFTGPGTDLTVGLADDHEWCGGAATSRNGITCNANIPTEEVFTTPHRLRVEGHVTSTKPLSYQGTLIEGIRVRFAEGRIVESAARTGGDVLARVLDTDEGARRLGEVALVPAGSAISASGLLFYNTLYDENAASHIALGQAYSKCFRNGGAGLSPEDLAERGANRSLIHIDWMIGSADVDVDGLDGQGRAVPVMRAGEWV
ncbi:MULTISPECIES: aminopeptidase [Methylobacterium]|uniref:Aminopeptidase T n=6 Tax=Pseudomonadota TaxID=1224 RepID=A0ABQ4SXL3_9HYPH|nr:MULTISPECIES: aminopeptidase [Methylobacterium]PIU07541.1 MAG: aminopeptidase [Methylobacterium sp. CG09_land_8_20_14_0_10_71_15]PIU13328.1 MAG: aminopeptidase [Methylobacterium sp. CG08_land_8_20_14_0_20_71_15]GBU17759.1 aminopeptidase [Methylobacterium sp.]GJE06411.1 Aminopeptidase T [Methylobacterium jeotgali]